MTRWAGSITRTARSRAAAGGAALTEALTGLERAFGAPGAPAANDDPFARHGLSGTWDDPAAARSVSARNLLLGASFRAVLGRGGSLLTGWG